MSESENKFEFSQREALEKKKAFLVKIVGGKITRLDGQPWDIFQSGEGMVVSNGHLHDQIVDLLNKQS